MPLLHSFTGAEIDALALRHGSQQAYMMALLAIQEAEFLGDIYAATVWREVQQSLRRKLAGRAEVP